MSDEALALAVGTRVAGKLRVLRALGVGGMGAVYEVEHELTRHRRALKLLHPELASSPQAVARFLREASAAGRIGNPHIVETFDAGTLESGEPYLVMELLSGCSLADLLDDAGRLSEARAIDLVAQACDGLQAAHEAGIIHRDIKPDNLFIERSGRVKILDFGISKFDEQLTGEQQLTGDLTLGTPYYMAPEQTSKTASVDRRADVYALGVVLYECVTGKKPFNAETYPQLVVRIHLGDYEPASSVCGTSAIVDAIIAKAMARRPESRFQTPAELAAALRDALAGTERTLSPFASTQRAHEIVTTPLEAAPREATLVSAGSQPPSAGRASRSWLLLGAALTALGGAAAWRLHTARGAVTELRPRAISSEPPVTSPPLVVPSPPSAPTHVPTPSAPSALPRAHAASPSPPKHSAPGSRARQHALEEENPFR